MAPTERSTARRACIDTGATGATGRPWNESPVARAASGTCSRTPVRCARDRMGTRVHVFLSTHRSLLRNTDEVLTRLTRSEPECLNVARYWRSVASDGDAVSKWAIWDDLGDHVNYRGPGSLGLVVTERAARIYASARWRGFLSIPPLRSVHLAAFRSIAAALGSDSMAITHDSLDSVEESFDSGATLDACAVVLRQTLGPPQPDVKNVDPAIVAATDRGVPDVWYWEPLSKRPEE
jgi:hypothetical protein